MKKLFAILAATMITCGIMVAPAFATEANLDTEVIHEGAVYESEPEAIEAMEAEEAAVPDTESVVYEEVIQMDDKVVTDQEAWDETIEHPAITHEETVVDEEAYDETIEHPAVTHEETVIDKEAYDETIEHPAVTHEETVVDKEAWDEQVCTPGTDPYGYKVEGCNRAGFTVEDGAFILIKQASGYVIIWSEDADFSDYPTAKEIAAAAKDGSIKNQVVIKWKGLGEFYPGNLGQPWHHWYGFCKNSEGIYFWVDNINGISHADVYVPGKPGECKTVHHDAITHQETIIDKPAWEETIHHDAVTHKETVVDKPAWTETVHHDAITHQETVVDKPAWTETVHHDAITHAVEQWTYVFVTELNPTPVPPAPTPVINNDQPTEVVITNTAQPVGQQYLPKTADGITPAGTIFLIVLASLVVLVIASPRFNKDEDEEE